MVATFRNQGGGTKSVVQANGTTTIVVAGGTGVSNLCSNSTEVVMGASINKVVYGGDSTTSFTVARVANLVGVYSGTGAIDYGALGCAISQDPTANITVTMSGTNGSIILELHKQSHF